MTALSVNKRISILIGLFIASIIAVLFAAPIPQDPLYHLFADSRSCLGLANFGDVMSNSGFAIVGLLGLWTVLGPSRDTIFESKADAVPYIVFFAGVGLVSVGSAYYHEAPDNARLFWDRLPMTVAFMALFAAIILDRIDLPVGRRALLPVLVFLGVLSLLYWDWSEGQGQGDLRFYGLVQFYPMLALPVICWLFPKANYTGGGYLIWVIIWYAIAKGLEHFDAEIFDLLGNTVSGHSLKHMASAVATYFVWRMIVRAGDNVR
jgi:hypothetical protein